MVNDKDQTSSSTTDTHFLDSSHGKLELRTALPATGQRHEELPVLFIHGTQCAASCYSTFLSPFAKQGYPAYALSLRNHGKSDKISWFSSMFLTTIDSFCDDVEVAIEYIKSQHNGQAPVLVAHSFGGGIIQYMLSTRQVRAPALVLLASLPLTGGAWELMANWTAAEAPNGYDWPWSRRYQLSTVSQVKAALFSDECPDNVIEEWLGEDRTPCESMRATLAVFYQIGSAEKILGQLDGLPGTGQKILCVGGGQDKLITKDVVAANVKDYRAVDGRDGVVEEKVVEKSGHHLMRDVAHEECADEKRLKDLIVSDTNSLVMHAAAMLDWSILKVQLRLNATKAPIYQRAGSHLSFLFFNESKTQLNPLISLAMASDPAENSSPKPPSLLPEDEVSNPDSDDAYHGSPKLPGGTVWTQFPPNESFLSDPEWFDGIGIDMIKRRGIFS
ncbi:alpha/beta-hydrolase [Microthyrium microscopicum]|uniref:Alpha/beta-hydrolase n=1 Tax=Microthyrium microscopicum TaxID=703497 RepID=A0A6A6UK35_9PEZI|nr:alpha/beta-hydrolase [Microthyrium microscopicum]